MFLVIKKSFFATMLIAILTMSVLVATPNGGSAQVFFGFVPRKIPVYAVQTEEKKVSISFDAAWGADKTEEIMNILKEYKANATFFLVGFWADKYPDLVKKIADNGFEIGTHSNTHPDMTKISDEQKKLELSTSVKTIEDASGKKVELFRAPFGAYNNSLLTIAESLNLKTIQWSIDSLDWKGITAQNIVTRVVSNAKNGDIILCHNNADNILKALPIILDGLQKKGFEVTNIGSLLLQGPTMTDRNGTQMVKIDN